MLKKRIETLEGKNTPASGWDVPVIVYNAADPDDYERKSSEALAAALAAGWAESQGPYAVFIPENGR